MSISDAYTEWASSYDSSRNLTRDLDAEVTRQLIGRRPRGTIIEAGCGTGKNTVFYSEIADTVHAFDFSDGMLAVASARVQAANVRFQRVDLAAAWPCPPHSADLVTFNLVLEHIEFLTPVLRSATDALTPGGEVFISELHPFKQYQGSQARFQDAAGREVRVPAFTHNVSDYLAAARECALDLLRVDEWWHADDPAGSVPRLITFQFRRPAGSPHATT